MHKDAGSATSTSRWESNLHSLRALGLVQGASLTAAAVHCGALPLEELIDMVDHALRASEALDDITDTILLETISAAHSVYWALGPPGAACGQCWFRHNCSSVPAHES